MSAGKASSRLRHEIVAVAVPQLEAIRDSMYTRLTNAICFDESNYLFRKHVQTNVYRLVEDLIEQLSYGQINEAPQRAIRKRRRTAK